MCWIRTHALVSAFVYKVYGSVVSLEGSKSCRIILWLYSFAMETWRVRAGKVDVGKAVLKRFWLDLNTNLFIYAPDCKCRKKFGSSIVVYKPCRMKMVCKHICCSIGVNVNICLSVRLR
jgi:hypothetical protein